LPLLKFQPSYICTGNQAHLKDTHRQYVCIADGRKLERTELRWPLVERYCNKLLRLGY